MAYVNVKRTVANMVAPERRTVLTLDSYHEKRERALPTLSEDDKQNLRYYTTPDGKTEANTYVVFLGTPVPKQCRIAMENDLSAGTVCEGVRVFSGSSFCLPCLAVDWSSAPGGGENMIPDFREWMSARYRFCQPDPLNKDLVCPGDGHRKCTNLDIVENYISMFHYTLLKGFEDPKYAQNAWLVLRTLRKVISSLGTCDFPSPLLVERVRRAIEDRETSVEKGVEYRSLVSSLHPAQYYYIMYELMSTHPECTMKNRVVNPETLIWGYLTQTCIKQTSKVEDLSKEFLRLYLERGLRKVGLPTSPQCQTKEELVAYLTARIPKKLQNVLRYGCLSWNSLKLVLLNPSLESFVSSINHIYRSMERMEGILPFCNLLDPKNTLDDASIAEIFLSACQLKEQFSILSLDATRTKQTPCMDELLRKVNASISVAHTKLEELKLQASESAEEIWSNCRVKYNREGVMNIARMFYVQASSGEEEKIPLLEELIELVSKVMFSKKRLVTLVHRCAPEDSAVARHFWRQKTDQKLGGWQLSFFWELGRRPVVIERDWVEEKENIPVKWVPVEVSRLQAREVFDSLVRIMSSVAVECSICYGRQKKMIVLHPGDVRHMVCEGCKTRLFRAEREVPCPFCRELCYSS